jgi:hypothetical protein
MVCQRDQSIERSVYVWLVAAMPRQKFGQRQWLRNSQWNDLGRSHVAKTRTSETKKATVVVPEA